MSRKSFHVIQNMICRSINGKKTKPNPFQGPDAFFYVGKRGTPNKDGYRVPYPKGDFDAVLGKFEGEDVVVELQNGWKTSDLKSVRGGGSGRSVVLKFFEFDLFF